jgi:glycosyltransferase involved in cell wall biosynthesis
MNALDLHVLSSAYGEAFPNVVAEAMAGGVPCVVTDVGDAALVVGDTGWVVPPRAGAPLARAIETALERLTSDRAGLASRSRERIERNFGMARMADAYSAVWQRASHRQAADLRG